MVAATRGVSGLMVRRIGWCRHRAWRPHRSLARWWLTVCAGAPARFAPAVKVSARRLRYAIFTPWQFRAVRSGSRPCSQAMWSCLVVCASWHRPGAQPGGQPDAPARGFTLPSNRRRAGYLDSLGNGPTHSRHRRRWILDGGRAVSNRSIHRSADWSRKTESVLHFYA